MQFELKEIIAAGASFLVMVSVAYLWILGAFNVHILDFIGVTDIVKIAVYPLIVSVLFYFVGAIIAQILFSGSLPVGGGEHTAIGQACRKNWQWLLALLAFRRSAQPVPLEPGSRL
jgi:hypothetical protein